MKLQGHEILNTTSEIIFQPIMLTGVDFVLEIVRDVMQRFLIITKDDDSNNMKVFVLQNPMI